MKLSPAQRRILEQMRDGKVLGYYESPVHPYTDCGYRWQGEVRFIQKTTIEVLLKNNLVSRRQAKWGTWTTPLDLTDEGRKVLEG